MKPFYSVLYIKPEPVSEERIAVGLFLNADKRPAFDYSEEKLKVAANLIGSDATDSIERMLRNIKKKADSVSKDKNQVEAFNINPFTESYFNYLNNYNNNLLLYSDPSENRGDFNSSDYRELFRLLIDKRYGREAEKEESFKTSVRKKINSSVVKEKMDVFYKVPKSSVKTIYRNHEVDYVGINGMITSGNSVDMEGDFYNLENRFNLFRLLAEGLTKFAENNNLAKGGHHTVFYNEPVGKRNKELLYDALHDDSNPVVFKHWEEFSEEEAWVDNNSFRKFSEVINT